MGSIKSKFFDDSITLDHESLKPAEMTKIRQEDEKKGFSSTQYVINQPEKIENMLIDQVKEKVSDLHLDQNTKKTNKSGMQSASAASFQPPDFLQRSQYFRSFRSASRRFFGKKEDTDISNNKISNENETSFAKNTPNRNYFYRSFKNLNRNNLNCISNLKNERENSKGEAQPQSEMKNLWFKNLKSRSNADFEKNSSTNVKKSSSREPILEESRKFPTSLNLTSKSLDTIPTLGFSSVEIDTDEPQHQAKPEMTSNFSNSSSSSAGISYKPSNGSITNSKSSNQLKKPVQIPIRILTEQQSVKQREQTNFINSVFLNELNILDDFTQKNNSLIENLKTEVEIVNRLLDVFDKDDPNVINELLFKTENLSNQAQKLQAEVKEQLKIKNKKSQMNRFTSDVVIKLYEDCIVKLDRQLEILIAQIHELTSIKQFLVQVVTNLNQRPHQPSPPSYGFSDSYFSSSSSDGYYPNYQQQSNFYYNPQPSYPSQFYAHSHTAYVEQPTAYYFTYRTPQQAELYYDTLTGQYFYRKPHVHMHPHAHTHTHTHTHTHPTNHFYPNQSHRNPQNAYHPNNEPATETKQNGGAIITEVSDDEDDHLRKGSNKNKDYVDAISLKGDE